MMLRLAFCASIAAALQPSKKLSTASRQNFKIERDEMELDVTACLEEEIAGVKELFGGADDFSFAAANATDGAASQSAMGYALDSVGGAAFAALHFGDNSGVVDSSKNLRVLWARALLAHNGMLEDDVAYELLPKATRGIVKTGLLAPLAKFGEWVSSRTTFIDSALDAFLEAAPGGQVVVLGAGFDTRAMRYPSTTFFEVDLSHVVAGKAKLWDRWDADARRPTGVAYDLNDAGVAGRPQLRDLLLAAGLDPLKPSLVISEAVLFYVDDAPTRALFDDVFFFAGSANSAVVMTDSFKPLLTSPFTHDARAMVESRGFTLLDHSSRWGGAVHFLLASKQGTDLTAQLAKKYSTAAAGRSLYISATGAGAARRREKPSFEDAWYALCFSEQLDDKEEVYASRLFGEPIVLYRDADGRPVAVADACPHRAAPLSMGTVSNGELRCIYHGWRFGAEGKRVDTKGGCSAKTFAVEEVDGLCYVWRGDVLSADASLLPRRAPGATPTHAVDTVLDYRVGFEYIVENNLDSLHLFELHDGSIPPISSLGMNRMNTKRLRMRRFSDDVGEGHVGMLAGATRPNKLVRFDAPNVVRHGGVSGFHEEFHIVPVAPQRTRVLLRQHLPKGPILTTILGVPGVNELLKTLVKNWNYHISLEDYSVMQGQQHAVDDLGAPRFGDYKGLGDDLISDFYQWFDAAVLEDGAPYLTRWADKKRRRNGPNELPGHSVVDDGGDTQGILKNYQQVQPVASFPPANPEPYLPMWNVHDAVMKVLGTSATSFTGQPPQPPPPQRSPKKQTTTALSATKQE